METVLRVLGRVEFLVATQLHSTLPTAGKMFTLLPIILVY